ncbi:MAG: hypothetical protein QG652_286, partial [Pseudomonadota bacterium]|nr:hypothetical protein [Pseudomonadota bacterium]
VPVAATVSAIDLFVRRDEQPWPAGRVIAGSDFGGGRFEVTPVEQGMTSEIRQVCHDLHYWGNDYVQARMVVRYVPDEKENPANPVILRP